ncbi:MAG: hypothetical protein QOI66_31 [Myxococcales bacterium]|nr:hypothetical protein [Myxococcales bacterium]
MVSNWLKARATDWSLTVDDTNASHGFTQVANAQLCTNGSFSLKYAASGYEVYWGITCPGAATPDLAGLLAAQSGAFVASVPPGLTLPGWTFRAYDMGSHPPSPVQLMSWDSGRVSVQIDMVSVFLNAFRNSEECQIRPGHDDVTSGCYVPSSPASGALRLTITAPLSPAEVRLPGT